MKIVSFKELIKNAEKLSKNPVYNKDKLDKLRDKIEDQMVTVDSFSEEKLNYKIETSDDKAKYKFLLKQKEAMEKYEDELTDIVNEKYDSVNKTRKIKKAKLYGLIAGSTLLIILGGNVIKNIKNDGRVEYAKEELRTESPTEDYTEVVLATEAPTTEMTTEATTEMTTETPTTEATTEVTTETTTEVPEVNSDLIDPDKIDTATDWFWKQNEKIDKVEETILDDDKREEAKQTAKDKVIEYTDFIFYGTEIDGKKFDDLKEEEKQKIYEKYQELINTVKTNNPEELEDLGENYQTVKDFGSLTLEKAKEKIKEKVGEEYYDSASGAGEAIKEGGKDTGKIVLNYLKNKYEQWRDKDDE